MSAKDECIDVTDPHLPAAGSRLLGAVVAGGAGRRFGRPKAGAQVAGAPMVQWVVAALATVTSDVVVVSSAPVPGAGVPVVPDRTPGTGPLGGLESALREADARGLEGVLLLACDMPLVTSDLLDRVATALEGVLAAAPSRGDMGIEPLCAAYRLASLQAVRRRLSSGDLSLHALFRDVGGRVIPREELGEAGQLLNVNTAEDRSRAEAILLRRRNG